LCGPLEYLLFRISIYGIFPEAQKSRISLAEHSLGVGGVGSSNLLFPTNFLKSAGYRRFLKITRDFDQACGAVRATQVRAVHQGTAVPSRRLPRRQFLGTRTISNASHQDLHEDALKVMVVRTQEKGLRATGATVGTQIQLLLNCKAKKATGRRRWS